MSYILEALKKAQSERQLGSAPTIHALPVHAPAGEAAVARRLPGLAIAGVLLAGAAALAWYVLREPVAVVAVPAPQAIAAAPAVPVALAPVPAQTAPPAAATPATPAALAAPAAPPQAVPFPPEPAAASPAAPAAASAKAVPVKTAPAEAPAPEEQLKMLRELPEAIQREVPSVAIGGYIYSKNPADRLLLIDKILRKEGDEVAPGLVLEKLLPKGAVMNYRGTRYRVPY